MFTVLAIVFFGGWLLAAAIGTWAYFAGEGDPNFSQE
nr:endonuclease [Kovacikia minuta]